MVHGSWFRIQGAGCRVQGAGCRVQGAGINLGVVHGARVEGGLSSEEQPPPVRHRPRVQILLGTVLNLRRTTSQKCAAVPRRARI